MQNSVESCYAGSIPTSTLQITNNKKIVVKGITGILSFKRCGRGSEQRLPQKPRLKKVNMAFCLQITEEKINRSTKSVQGSLDAILT